MGIELVEVPKLLGHSELPIAADLYSHLLKEPAAKAAYGRPARADGGLVVDARCASGCGFLNDDSARTGGFAKDLEPALGLEPRTC